MQTEKLFNWRQVSKLLTDSSNATAIRKGSTPKKYYKEIDALYIALQEWENEYVHNKPREKKFTIEQITAKLKQD